MKMHWPAIANMLYPCICHSEFRNSEQKELKLSVTHLSLENNLPTFQLNVPIVIMAKVKEVRANVAIYSHALLRSKVGEDCSSLPASYTAVQQPGTSSPPSRLQGLLHQQFLSSTMVQYCVLLPVGRVVVLPL